MNDLFTVSHYVTDGMKRAESTANLGMQVDSALPQPDLYTADFPTSAPPP